jgi:hypothetical protein
MADQRDVMNVNEGIDSFTLLHHDLNICTNSVLDFTVVRVFLVLVSKYLSLLRVRVFFCDGVQTALNLVMSDF